MCALVTGVQTCALPIYVAQFSGFHKFCENFPYDFVEKKASERESGLSMAYIAISKVSDQIQNRVFNRPLADRKSVGSGKSVSVRVDLGGRRIIKKNKSQEITKLAHNNHKTNSNE